MGSRELEQGQEKMDKCSDTKDVGGAQPAGGGLLHRPREGLRTGAQGHLTGEGMAPREGASHQGWGGDTIRGCWVVSLHIQTQFTVERPEWREVRDDLKRLGWGLRGAEAVHGDISLRLCHKGSAQGLQAGLGRGLPSLNASSVEESDWKFRTESGVGHCSVAQPHKTA